MNCEEVNALVAEYALDALGPDDRAAVAAHLERCGLHGEVAALRAATLALGASVPPVDPPPALRARVLADVAARERARAVARSEGQLGDEDSSTAAPLPAVPRRREPRRWLPYAMAAAFAAIAIGLGAWNATLLRGGDTGGVRSAADAAQRGDLLYVAGRDLAVLRVRALPPLAPDRTYQVWVIRAIGGAPEGVALFSVASDGTADVVLDATLAAGDIVAVTEEPSGGSPAPTSDPLVVTRL